MDPRFQRVLRPIAAVTLFFFSWISIEPWNYAIAAQAKGGPPPAAGPPANPGPPAGSAPAGPPASPGSPSGAPAPASAAGGFESTLRLSLALLEKLPPALDQGQDVTALIATLTGYRDALAAADPQIRSEFTQTGAFLNEKNLPDVIKQRHADAVADYTGNYDTLAGNLASILSLHKEMKTAQAQNAPGLAQAKLASLKGKLTAALAQLRIKLPPPRHQLLNLESPPGRARELVPVNTSLLNQVSDFLFPAADASEPPPPTTADLSETLETPQTEEIRDLAEQLGGTPVALYEFVRNAFAYEPYIGSTKGAVETLHDRAGNEWDLASLLITLYRSQGIPARYVVGTAEIPIDRAMSWLGVENPNMAAALLNTQGRPTSVVSQGGKIAAIRTRQVWVQAYVPFRHSRGATTGPGDTWVDLDPSFKLQQVSQTLNLTGAPTFDQAAYLQTFRPESPVEFYKGQIQTFLDTASPGYVPEALGRNLEIVPEYLGVLIGQTPYPVVSVTATYSEIPDAQRQKVTFTLTDPLDAEAVFGTTPVTYTVPIPQILGKRLTLSYTGATDADRQTIQAYGNLYNTPPYLIRLVPELKLEGQTIFTFKPVGSGQDQIFKMVFQGPLGQEQVVNTVIAGEYYAIALNGHLGSGNHEGVFDRSQRLAQIAETINLADPATLDDRLGELLYLTGLVFQHNLNMATRQMIPLHGIVDIRDVAEMMFFLTVKVDGLFGSPSRITPTGITGDMDRDTHLIVPIDGNLARTKPFMQLEGNQNSFLEHSVTEGVYQTDAISAVKAIQLAHDQSIPVHTVSQSNSATILPTLQLDPAVKTEISNAVNAGRIVITPERSLTLFDWAGVGYIIQHPTNGEGAYRISGGFGGAAMVHDGYIQEMINNAFAEYAKAALDRSDRPVACYPGEDNVMFNEGSPCFQIVLINEVEDVGPCMRTSDGSPTACEDKYGISSPGRYHAPLIEASPSDLKLTQHISVGEWMSDDGAPYMRAGVTVLMLAEAVRFVESALAIIVSEGYRSQPFSRTLKKTHPETSLTSFHLDGLAIDFNLSRPGFPVTQCDMIRDALTLTNSLSGNSGFGLEISTKGKTSGVHFAVPVDKVPQSPGCGIKGWR